MTRKTPRAGAAFIQIDRKGEGPLTARIYHAIRSAILAGSLRPGTRLPASRILANHLGVSRKPVLLAYERLVLERYLHGQTGSGTYVAHRPLLAASPAANLTLASWVHAGERRTRLASNRPFSPAGAAFDLFPHKKWAQLLTAALREGAYGTDPDPCGLPTLRRAIAEQAEALLGFACGEHDVVVVAAAEQSLATVARLFAEPGETMLLDNPFDRARTTVSAAAGLRSSSGLIDDGGLDVESELAPPRLAYLRPSSEGVSAVPMSLGRRYSVLAWARRHQVVVIEDDFDALVDPREESHPSLRALDSRGVVVYVAALWRALLPASGIGFAVVPASVAEAIAPAATLLGGSLRLAEQAALAAFLESGGVARHLRTMRSAYAERRECAQFAIMSNLSGAIVGIERGPALQLILRLAPGCNDVAVAEAAEACGIEVLPLSPFDANRSPALLAGYGGMTPDAIVLAAESLAMAVDSTICRQARAR